MTESTGDLRQRTSAAVGWTILEKWSGRLLSLAVFAVLTRLLDPSSFGMFSLATAVVAVLGTFIDSGFTKAIVQRPTLRPIDTSTTFWSSVAISIVVYAVLWLTAAPLATLMGEPDLAPILQVAGIALPISALSRTSAALLERDLHYRPLAMRQLSGAGAGVWALVAQILVTAVVSTLLLWFLTAWRPALEFSRESFRSMMSFGVHTLGIELLASLQANIDKVLVGAFFDARTLGYYFVAQRATGVVLELATSVFGRVSLSVLSRVQADRDRMNRVLRQLTLISSLVALPVFATLAFFADDLLPLLVGPGWAESNLIFQILAFSSGLAAVMYFDVNALTAVGRPSVALRLSIVQNLVGVALMLLAAPFGPAAVAWSRSVRLLVMWPLRLWSLRRSAGIEIKPYVGQVGRTTLGLVPAGAIAAALASTPWGKLDSVLWSTAPIAAISLGAYYAVTWWLIGPESRCTLLRTARTLRRSGEPSRDATERDADRP